MTRLCVTGLAVALTLLGGACSSSASVDVAAEASATVEAAGAAADEAIDQAQDAVEDAIEDGDSTESGSSADSSAAAEALLSGDWCASAEAIQAQFDDLDDVDFTDPVALEQTYSQVGEVIKASVAIAPPEIAVDVTSAASGFTVLTDALEAVDWDFLALDLSVLDEIGPQMELASFNIEKYNFEVCGIDNGFDPADDPRLAPDDETAPLEGSIRDEALAGLIAAGFSEAEAACIFENIDISDPAAMADSAGLVTVFSECGISIERLAELGG